jgi:hypothetical protein
MIIGSIRSQIDQIWNAFWSGGVSNPISVIEQLTFLMFIKPLDDLHTVQERQSEDLSTPNALANEASRCALNHLIRTDAATLAISR